MSSALGACRNRLGLIVKERERGIDHVFEGVQKGEIICTSIVGSKLGSNDLVHRPRS